MLKRSLECADVTSGNDVGATATAQQISVEEIKGRESDSPSLSFEDYGESDLEGGRSDFSDGTSSDPNSNSPFKKENSEEVHKTGIPVIDTVGYEVLSDGIKDVNSGINVNQPNKCVEQVANGNGQPETRLPGIDEQNSKSGLKKNPQNTKRYVVAASALAIAGIVSGVAVAVSLEMLVVGIAVAACYLIVATITYCYRPKSLVEDNQVKKVMQTEECQSKY
ncbi:TomO hydrophobic C-terminal domain-containing protein [Wolbachia endosymbiont of Trichogramma pretiosum]|uniref:TomO hydrophobic C-terminal domain-containing protein n=1 Tax=Wolbachia endosymbiont of Trichogramma pretiosum TaxID=125593 RepID=UPI0008395630|nr:hypothetical protein [Wolbachia endosymbiont of Trichogramma pretiosum]OCA06563.1 ankyrin repeat domain protein [Wolbachia endosymbiont of Trichogramma pretiosum]